MDLIGVRALAKTTIVNASTLLQASATEFGADVVFTTPRVTFNGRSPVVTIELQELRVVDVARGQSYEPYRLDVYVLATASADLPEIPSNLADLAEDQVCTIVGDIVPALRTAGFTVGVADFSPRNAPWRRVDKALVYRWCMVPIEYDDVD